MELRLASCGSSYTSSKRYQRVSPDIAPLSSNASSGRASPLSQAVKAMKRTILVLAITTTLALLTSAQVHHTSPSIEAATSPVYPQIALLSATGGDVVVQVHIGANGQVISAKVIEGPKLLQEASLDAAHRWSFSSGEAGREAQLTFSFRVMPKTTAQIELTPVFKPPYKVEVRGVVPEISSNSSHDE